MYPPRSRYRFGGSFRSKLFLVFTFLTFLIALSFMVIAANNEARHYRERSGEKARLLATMLADAARLPLFAGDITTLEKLVGQLLASGQAARVVIADSDRRVLLDRGSSPDRGQQSGVTASAQVLPSDKSHAAETALTGVPGVAPVSIGSVSVSIDTSSLKQSIITTLFKTAGVVLLFWAAMLAISYPILKRITRSFHSLTAGLDTMLEGNFALKISVETNDEAGRAAQAVNRLAAALEEREADNRNLQAELLLSMRLEVQEEKRKLMAKLIQTNRMTSLGLLISSMAHNINTPNGAIKLAAQYIQRSWKDIVPLLEYLAKEEGDFQVGGLRFSEAKGEFSSAVESICRNAERVERVIQDLRSYNVGERRDLCSGMSVNQAVEGALTVIRAHGRQAEITINYCPAAELPTITGNQHQLEQVVVNLLLNAMQAMPDGRGTVTVTTRHDPLNHEVLIIVSDQGAGIPDSVMHNLFEPFTSTRIDKGGSGLGLYISNFIVTEHKGAIAVQTSPDHGTTITVHLPDSSENSRQVFSLNVPSCS